MPRTKSLSHYPTHYAKIIRECGEEGAILRMPCETIQEARSIKGQWHAYLGSLHFAVRELTRRGPPFSDDDTALIDLSQRSPAVMIQIEDRPTGVSVLWQNRDSSWQVQRLKGIVREGTTPLAIPQEDAMARLLAVQSDTDKGKNDGNA